MTRHLPLLRLFFLALALGARVFAADAAAYDRQIAGGQALIEKGSYPEAFAELQRAVAADSGRYEGYFELAVVSYRMGNLGAAEEFAKLALERAPEAEQPSIREMIGVIGEKRGFEQLEREGDEAFGNGLMAKAAESYRKAYLLFPNQGAVGLRAAAIYADTLDRLLDAAVLWQKIAGTADTESAAAALEALAQHAAALDRLAETRLAAAKQAGGTEQMLQLTEAFPRNLELRLELAAAFAAKRDAANTVRQLAEANKLGLKVAVVKERPEFLALLDDGAAGVEFARFLEDAFGGQVLATMREDGARLAREENARLAREARAREEAKAREEARLAEIRARAEREQRERDRKERELAVWRNPTGKNLRISDLALDLVWLAPGTFSMGSTNGDDDERPVLGVTLSSGFWLGKTEVTQAQWQAVMGNNPSMFQGDDRPVEYISFEDAMEFCQKLTERERKAGRLADGLAYRLPTEAQWEYACRAGTTGDYAGPLSSIAWYEGNAANETHRVGRKKPNAWGLHDMHGNVWEWCRDWYSDSYSGYPGGTQVTNPIGPSSGTRRVARGGGFTTSARQSRSANRLGGLPNVLDGEVGFRLALIKQ